MTAEILLTVAGLALLDTLSPATIGVTIYLLLTADRRLAPLLFTYLGTVAAFYFTLGVALVLGLDVFLAAAGDALNTRTSFWIQAVIGAAMLIGSFLIPTKRAAPSPRTPRVHTLPAMIGFGLTTGLLEAGMALPYLGAIGILISADVGAHQWLPVIAGYNLVMVLPPVLMYLAWNLLGARIRPRLQRWRDKIAGGTRETMAWILGIAGFLVLRDAVFRLSGDGSAFPF
ncbi:GAP family protein [Actinobacteria bacterium YIM 96077]|uniref:GAP family protein n=1 Tax=Phytoactinopolyspora halophila TaxID=1981511 RepID=A0A329QVJ6_9ACTN|nr:GAP family protein [Phytoactinopolyspora halophila]AYY12767.1 GAP family protein [Actinobacteria bacterium YIM 96077]RAW16440.1 GAP family protein [Phytoactinopolyspora halophila]